MEDDMDKEKTGTPASEKPVSSPGNKAGDDRDKAAERAKVDPPDFYGEKEPNPGHPV